MASTFKNAISAGIGTGATSVLTAGSGKQVTVIGVSLANTTSSAITAVVQVTDTSATATAHIVKDVPLAVGASAVVIGGEQKLVLEATDILKITSSASSSIDAVVSYVEIS